MRVCVHVGSVCKAKITQGRGGLEWRGAEAQKKEVHSLSCEADFFQILE